MPITAAASRWCLKGWWRNCLARDWSAPGAADASGYGWIKLKPFCSDCFAAVGAVAEFAFVHSRQSGQYPLPHLAASGLGGLGHGLLLKRVHAAEAANRLLIERDGFLPFAPQGIFAIKCGQFGLQAAAKIIQMFGIHHENSCPSPLRFVSNAYL